MESKIDRPIDEEAGIRDPGGRISQRITNLSGTPHADRIFDVIIVGSGYGGSVAAAALGAMTTRNDDGTARRLDVCVLERGREYLPGEFPSGFSELPAYVRVGHQTTGTITGDHEALLDIRLGDDVLAMVANGVGGGSLINAGVLLEPYSTDFDSSPLMSRLVGDLGKSKYFERARTALGGAVVRNGQQVLNTIDGHADVAASGPLKKTAALKTLAGTLKVQHPPLSVSMDKGPNDAGVQLAKCTLCGDCMTGCNVGAKDSLDTNLLVKAHLGGVKIYSGATVSWLERTAPTGQEAHWIVHVAHTQPRIQRRETALLRLRARKVILAAGAFGTTEILLRSREEGLAVSGQCGQKFSCNGDNLAAVHGMPSPTDSTSDEDSTAVRRVGPTITASIVDRASRRGRLYQEFAVPAPLKTLFDEIVTTANVVHDLPTADLSRHGREEAGIVDPLAVNPDAMARTLLVGTIGHDAADGVLQLVNPPGGSNGRAESGAIKVAWQAARTGAELVRNHEKLSGLVARLGGGKQAKLIPNPAWKLLPTALSTLVSQPVGPVLTVHPLGGCPMGEQASDGVVDEFGRVFEVVRNQTDLWEGSLIALDGSILPTSLGVNPALTITAIAMRAMDKLCQEWRYVESPAGTSQVLPDRLAGVGSNGRRITDGPASAPTPTTIEIAERLSGNATIRVGPNSERQCVLELTLRFEPARVRDLVSTLHRKLSVSQRDDQSRLRIFDSADWESQKLQHQPDHIRSKWALFDATLSGDMRLLHREVSTPTQRAGRSIHAWFANRGWRDILQSGNDPKSAPMASLSNATATLLNYATRAGEVRRLDYALRVTKIHTQRWNESAGTPPPLREGDAISASKRLTYNRRANPWRQLMELSLDAMPGLRAGRPPVLALDLRFLANQSVPLLRLTQQQDQARALRDLLSLALHLARIIVSTHLWSFRSPDSAPYKEPLRLPGPIKGIAGMKRTYLKVDSVPKSWIAKHASGNKPAPAEIPVMICLTRYPPSSSGSPRGLPPLVMIHGYSVSGNTFTHPSLKMSAAEYFSKQGRDVWVVDLRTSTAFPETARYPWSMEQVALVDIPAALLHIRGETGQRVDVLAHCIGCVMLSMALLADDTANAISTRSHNVVQHVDVNLTDEQQQALARFNGGDRKSGTDHPSIRRIVLSQKGPLLRYTDSNVFRAFVFQSIRRWLMQGDYQFNPAPPAGVASQLLDRFLATLPYTDTEYDIENPSPRTKLKLTPWTRIRHRMDALYGRDFEAANLDELTLLAIDDLFGPINLDTVAQTIHFARFNAITNQRGRGEFVTRGRLAKRWGGIPTLAIHGKLNGLVDQSTQDLLASELGAAGIPIQAISAAQAPYNKLGHQDVLIGKTNVKVFKDIEEFLGAPTRKPQAVLPSNPVIVAPWLGPRIDVPDSDGDAIRVACMPRPEFGQAQLVLALAAAKVDLSGEVIAVRVVDLPKRLVLTAVGDNQDWLFVTPNLQDVPNLPKNEYAGYLTLLVYSADEAYQASPPNWPSVMGGANDTGVGDPGGKGLSESGGVAGSSIHPTIDNVLPLLKAHVSSQPMSALADALIFLSDLQNASDMREATCPVDQFSFAVGSCQYASGLLDKQISDRNLAMLASSAPRGSPPHVSLALLVGDQIYADPTAGLFDPVRPDERYDAPHENAFRLAGMRRLLRTVPVQMLLDDHEIDDNWEPLAQAVASQRPEDDQRNQLVFANGFAAWQKFQRMRLRGAPAGSSTFGDLDFSYGGYPFFLADTRSGRSARGTHVPKDQQRILNAPQFAALTAWLLAHKDEVKFVVTPSLLLPRRRMVASDAGEQDFSDAWDGFPESIQDVLAFIASKQIGRTVFLSGDEHHSLFAEIEVSQSTDPDQSVKVVSIHSSGLYAPLPFANGRPSDFDAQDRFRLGPLSVKVQTTFAPQGDGYARLTVHPPPTPSLEIEFCRAGHPSPPPLQISLR